jgi:hypothetical protein
MVPFSCFFKMKYDKKHQTCLRNESKTFTFAELEQAANHVYSSYSFSIQNDVLEETFESKLLTFTTQTRLSQEQSEQFMNVMLPALRVIHWEKQLRASTYLTTLKQRINARSFYDKRERTTYISLGDKEQHERDLQIVESSNHLFVLDVRPKKVADKQPLSL